MNLNKTPNINYAWSQLIVEELIRCKADYFCISPGSRSSALTIAVAAHPKAKSFIHVDERASAFHALGYTSATQKPCVIITTSGTAAANLFPAVIEASKKKLPLIILTADRPPELRFTGAHQTIDQVKMFGNYVNWHFDMPCPTTDISPAFVLTTIDQAIFKSQSNHPGPVHINCMFREPLSLKSDTTDIEKYFKPIRQWRIKTSCFTTYVKATPALLPEIINQMEERLKSATSGIIVVGKLSCENDRLAVMSLAERIGWPVFADITSGLRLGNTHKNVIHYYDQLLMSEKITKKYKPDAIIHLGGRITSKRWYDYVKLADPKEYITVLNHSLRNDPLHNVTMRIQAPVGLLCAEAARIHLQKSRLLACFQKLNKQAKTILTKTLSLNKKLHEAHVAHMLSLLIPKNHGLFLASSLPIREIDTFAAHDQNNIVIGANRGASGIDGTIATASGFSSGLNKPVTLLIGDLAFLYDLNSLIMLNQLKHPMIIIVLNNNGGAIFSQLPIAENNIFFNKYFKTPHNITFKSAAELFKVNYYPVKTLNECEESYKNALKKKTPSIIEVFTNDKDNVQLLKTLKQSINKLSC